MRLTISGRITGRVQGVFFRAATRRQALQLGVCGWVRNTADGQVEVLIQGLPEAVMAMQEWLQRGPEQAVVESVDLEPVSAPLLQGFDIRY